MNELIKTIQKDDGTIAVSGRELHDFLGIETRFNDWFQRMIGYGFSEGTDFYSFLSKTSNGGRPAQDYVMTIDMAKEVSMIQRNEKGKQARQYFIQIEKQYNNDLSNLSPELQLMNNIVKKLAANEMSQKRMDQKLNNIVDIVGTSTMDWRKSTQHLINRIVQKQGGDVENWKMVRNDIYDEVDRRAGASLSTRLTNLKRRMAEEGTTKSKRDKTTKVDVIERDKKLIEIYLAVVKDFALKYGVWKEEY